MSDAVLTPATDRLAALQRAHEAAQERLRAVRARVRGDRPILDLLLDLPEGDAAELAAAEREAREAGRAVVVEADAGADERWREHVAQMAAQDVQEPR